MKFPSAHRLAVLGLLVFGLSWSATADLPEIRTVFLIMMENHSWETIRDTNHCPFINQVLLPQASFAENYYTPTNNHPSEPNYIWLVAGTNFGALSDQPPSVNAHLTTNHLAFQLDHAGVSWRTYQEDISGNDIPNTNNGNYAVRHNPFMFFPGITSDFGYCTNHVRPFTELAPDLAAGRVARFNFITPNLTNDMHNLSPGSPSTRTQGDRWLRDTLAVITASPAFQDRGAVFITWDEGAETATDPTRDGPIGLIVLSPLGKGGGYHNSVYYTHSSTLRTVQEIFSLRPFLGDAANANDLADLFQPASSPRLSLEPGFPHGPVKFQVTGAEPGRAYELRNSTDLLHWSVLSQLVATDSVFELPATNSPDGDLGFFRLYSP